MALIQFSHATGIPARTYDYLFELLAPHEVRYVEAFGIGKFKMGKNWDSMVDELIDSISSQPEPVVGIGHSFGAVLTMRAVAKRPELFRQVILLDPPFLDRKTRFIIRWGRRILGLNQAIHLVPIAKQAANRKDTFASLDEARTYWKPKPFFKRWHPRCFEDYVTHALIPDGKGSLSLRTPRKLEAEIFVRTPGDFGPTHVDVPSHYLHAAKKGIVSPEEIANYHQKAFTDTGFISVDAGHMFPVEMPEKTADMIKRLILE